MEDQAKKGEKTPEPTGDKRTMKEKLAALSPLEQFRAKVRQMDAQRIHLWEMLLALLPVKLETVDASPDVLEKTLAKVSAPLISEAVGVAVSNAVSGEVKKIIDAAKNADAVVQEAITKAIKNAMEPAVQAEVKKAIEAAMPGLEAMFKGIAVEVFKELSKKKT